VHRHLEKGQKPIEAAVAAMKEIFGPIIAMTITLAAVYAPIGFVQGLTGTLFREFAYALAGAVILSGIIAVTLSPMMSSRLLKHEDESRQDEKARQARRAAALSVNAPRLRRIILGVNEFAAGFPQRVDRSFAWLSEQYQSALKTTLALRGLVVALSAVVLFTAGVMFMHTPKELAPTEDQGFMMSFLQSPRYATASYSEDVVKRMTAAVGKIPEMKTSFGVVGAFGPPNTAVKAFVLKAWSERHRSQAEIIKEIQQRTAKVAGAQIAIFSPLSLPGSGDGFPIQYVIRSIGTPAQVFDVAEKMRAKAMQTGRFFLVQNSATYDQPQARVEIDRDRAAALGVSIADIGSTLSVLMSEGWIARFDLDNRSYQIIPQVALDDRYDPEKMGRFYVRSASGQMVPLSALVVIKTTAGPQSIEQFNQLNAATLSAVAVPGTTLGQALQIFHDIGKEVMPDGFFEDYSGEARVSNQEGNSLTMAFIFALLVIYLVLAAQFESFRDPLIIMTAVPLSIFGALVPLNIGAVFQVTGATLNIYTQLGLITLVGLIAKHGILLVQFANDRREAGVPLEGAILEAAQVRLRPILMTTAAMVMGVAPLLFASGAGASARFSIGLVIASGMAIGTSFTLFVVPVFYTYISRKDAVRPKVAEPPHPAETHDLEQDDLPGPRRRAL
jgi:multidrug efflux pump